MAHTHVEICLSFAVLAYWNYEGKGQSVLQLEEAASRVYEIPKWTDAVRLSFSGI